MLCKDPIKASCFKKYNGIKWVTDSGLKVLTKVFNSLCFKESKIEKSAVSKKRPSPASKDWQVNIH